MQHLPHLLTLLVGLPKPTSIARRSARRAERSSRNSMADRPQDFDGGLGPAVRSVQHLNFPTDHRNIGDAGVQVIGKAKVPFPC